MIKQITWDDQWIGYDDEDTGTSPETHCYYFRDLYLHLIYSTTLMLQTPPPCLTSKREAIN